MRIQASLVILCVSLFLQSSHLIAQELTVVTEDSPPLQIVNPDGSVGGFATEVAKAMFKEAGTEVKIEVYPWSRAYMMALDNKNVLIYSISRTQKREKLFKWVGEIYTNRFFLYALKSNTNIEIESVEDLKKYSVSVPRDWAVHQILKEHGLEDFRHIQPVNSLEQALSMLDLKRVDMIYTAEMTLKSHFKTIGRSILEVNKVYEIEDTGVPLSIAFSLHTSDEVVNIYREALNKIKQKGIYSQIVKQWHHDL